MSPNLHSLTAKQKKVYFAIEAFIKAKSYPPTVREIGEILGEKTPGAVQGILNRLEQKGVIKREIGVARSIQLVSNDTLYANPIFVPVIKKISKRHMENLFNVYNIEKYQPISPDIITPGKNYFIINCPDNSMAESGINYGDILVICTDCELNDGDIVLVSYENFTLLRKYYSDGNSDAIVLKADSNLIDREKFNRSEVFPIN